MRDRLIRFGGIASMLPLSAVASGTGDMPSLVHDIGYCVVLAGVLAIVFTRIRIPVIAEKRERAISNSIRVNPFLLIPLLTSIFT